ncbi:DMT family transporter [Candidatus Bathyarchaeota archaeon]|nr:MAG: DMT family transporter [Candidatus Bathyarchaeota archaeon]
MLEGEALGILTAFLWAASTILSAQALRETSPIRVNAVRTAASAIVMPFISLALGELQNVGKVDPFHLFLVVVAAIIGFGLGDTFLFKSITLIGVSRSYTIAYTYPLFTVLIAIPALGENILPKHLLGAVLITLGVILVTSTEKESHDKKRMSLLGFLGALANSILWAVGTVLVTAGLKGMSVTLANTLRFPLLSVFLFALSNPRHRWNLTRRNVFLIVLSGIVGMVIGGITFLLSIKFIGASRATALSATSPVWAAIMSSLILREKVSVRVFAASLVVMLGVYALSS